MDYFSKRSCRFVTCSLRNLIMSIIRLVLFEFKRQKINQPGFYNFINCKISENKRINSRSKEFVKQSEAGAGKPGDGAEKNSIIS